MIEKINIFKYTNISALNNLKKLSTKIKFFNLPKLKTIKEDTFEHSFKDGFPEVLTKNPRIIEGKFDIGLKDNRFAYFNTEYRAYNYEGYEKFPSKYVCIDSNGQRRLKPHIYLSFVEIKPEYARQGAFKNAMKLLSQAAKNEKDCEGRIILEARKIESPSITQIPSPSIAHWRCGFRFINKDNNAIMKRVMKGELPLEAAPEGTMYYANI